MSRDITKQKIAQHASYLRNKERYHTKQRQTRAVWKERINQLKSVPCTDCGVQYPYYVMQFDHKDRSLKKGNVARLALFGSWKQIEEEIKKCEVVCANCHMVRTYLQNKMLL